MEIWCIQIFIPVIIKLKILISEINMLFSVFWHSVTFFLQRKYIVDLQS